MVPLCPFDGARGDHGQEERQEAAVRGGGAAAPEHDGEDVGDLEQETCESVAKTTRAAHSCRGARARDQWSRAVQELRRAGDAQMPTWGDQRLRRVFPSLELTTATCGAEHQRRQMTT